MQEDNIVVFTQMNEYTEWRCGVQTACTLPNSSCTGVVGGDSMIYSLEADDDGSHIRTYDMGYMEVWHLAVLEPGRFITTSFSGCLSEVIDGKFGLREPFPKIKSVLCMNLSPSGKVLAMGGAEGGVDIVDTKTLKTMHTFEAHWTRITSILMLSDDQVLTGGLDKYIKYFKVSVGSHSLERTLCGHRGAVSCMVPAPSLGQTTAFASASLNGQVIVWNLDSATPLTQIEVPHEGAITALAFSPCGQFLVSGGDDKLLSVYRVAEEPLDENVPLLNSGVELMEQMQEMNGGKENEEPMGRREEHREHRSEEEMEVDNDGEKGTARDLFGDSSDSDDGERRREVGEEREEEEDERRDEDEGDEAADEEGEGVGGEYEGYGREEEEEGERADGGGYEEEERREEEGEDERRDEEERREEGEGSRDGEEQGYIPSKIKKEEPVYEGYGDSPRGEDNPPTTPPFEEE